jgi:acetyl-CoA carboxylase carboxyl transferase subunit alpha
LWKDRSAAAKAAEALKITAKHLLELKLVDEIIPEPLGGAHTNLAETAAALREVLIRNLETLSQMNGAQRLKHRYEKFRAFGHFLEKGQTPEKPAPRRVGRKASLAAVPAPVATPPVAS